MISSLKLKEDISLLQLLSSRVKCHSGRGGDLAVCHLHGHLPLADQDRGPALRRPSGPQDVQRYRLGTKLPRLMTYAAGSPRRDDFLLAADVPPLSCCSVIETLLFRSWRSPRRKRRRSTIPSCPQWCDLRRKASQKPIRIIPSLRIWYPDSITQVCFVMSRVCNTCCLISKLQSHSSLSFSPRSCLSYR